MNRMCEVLQETQSIVPDNNALALGLFLQLFIQGGQLEASYNNEIAYLRNEELTYNQERQSLYLNCKQISLFRSSKHIHQPWLANRFPSDYFVTLCNDVFGPLFTEQFIRLGNALTNQQFGGNLPFAENVYFTYAGLDPYQEAGIFETIRASSPVDVFPRQERQFNVFRNNVADGPVRSEAKARARQLVVYWLFLGNY